MWIRTEERRTGPLDLLPEPAHLPAVPVRVAGLGPVLAGRVIHPANLGMCQRDSDLASDGLQFKHLHKPRGHTLTRTHD